MNYDEIYKTLQELREEVGPMPASSTPMSEITNSQKHVSPEKMLKWVAERINANSINLYDKNELNWCDVTLYEISHIRTLFDLLDIDKMDEVAEAIYIALDEEYALYPVFYHFTVKSEVYGTERKMPEENDWDYRNEIDVIKNTIKRRKEKAAEFANKMKPKVMSEENQRLQAMIDTVETQFTSIAKGRTISDLLKARNDKRDFALPTPEEIEKLSKKLASIDTRTAIEELFPIAYKEFKSKNVTLEEDWVHVCERCCELQEDNERLKNELETQKKEFKKLESRLKKDDEFSKYATYDNVVSEIAKTDSEEERNRYINFFRILLPKMSTSKFKQDIKTKLKEFKEEEEHNIFSPLSSGLKIDTGGGNVEVKITGTIDNKGTITGDVNPK